MFLIKIYIIDYILRDINVYLYFPIRSLALDVNFILLQGLVGLQDCSDQISCKPGPETEAEIGMQSQTCLSKRRNAEEISFWRDAVESLC